MCTGFSIILLLLSLYFTFWAVRETVRGVKSASWPTTLGMVKSSHVEQLIRGRRTSREIHRFEYEYTVNQTPYNGSRVSFKFPLMEKKAEDTATEYPVDKEVTVYYHPERPQLAVLEIGVSLGNLFLLVLFVAIDVLLLALWLGRLF